MTRFQTLALAISAAASLGALVLSGIAAGHALRASAHAADCTTFGLAVPTPNGTLIVPREVCASDAARRPAAVPVPQPRQPEPRNGWQHSA